MDPSNLSFSDIYRHFLSRMGILPIHIDTLVSAQIRCFSESTDPAREERRSLSQIELATRYLDSVCQSCSRNFKFNTSDPCTKSDVCSQLFEAYNIEIKMLSLIN